MNASESIVQSYFQYIEGIYTRANVKGAGQAELDLVGVRISGISPTYYHVESTVSISAAFSKITVGKYDPERAKKREKQAKQRRTVGFILARKFYSKEVLATYKQIGIDPKNLKRVLVSWDFQEKAQQQLEANGITCLSIKTILQELADILAKETADIDSDILRTLQLFIRAKPKMPEILSVNTIRRRKNLSR